MATPHTTVEVKILDKDYLVACPEDARESLERSARHLDRKMREIRQSGKVSGTERIAVLAALNVTHELLQRNTLPAEAERVLSQMSQKLDQALEPRTTNGLPPAAE